MTKNLSFTQCPYLVYWMLILFSTISSLAQELPVSGVYTPVDGGFRIHMESSLPSASQGETVAIGLVNDNPRLHRRPLYPPSDKSLIWNEEQREKMAHCGFRPLVLAYNEPRFLFDFHAAGGLLGHLFIGLMHEGGEGKWFHQWSGIEVRYVNGEMVYALSDEAFPNVKVHLEAAAQADSVGLVIRVRVDGLDSPCSLVWAYGGASAFFTNYAMTAPQFTFSPDQCARDTIQFDDNSFTLFRAFDKTDAIMNEPFAAARFLPDWKAEIRGGSSWKTEHGFGDPAMFVVSPATLVSSSEWVADSQEKQDKVAVFRAPVSRTGAEGYVVVGMGGDIEKALRHPRKAFEAAQERNKEIASRLVVETPDAHLNAAATMMAFATDGLWGDSTIMHGGWSWRFGYLGWRGWYGPVCLGWTDRIKRAIENYTRMGLIPKGDDAGALTSLLDTPGGVFYNMNEVFIDHVRQYFDYTNDLELMGRIFPVLESVVAWENRRLQPGNESLYESALNTWISDSHWYIQGQCTQASAYMLRAHELLGDLARRLGKDPVPYLDKARRIREAMQSKLWMKRDGVFAEYLDRRGHRLLHTEPELPTIYHSAEFVAADPLQIYQMLHWVDTHLLPTDTPGGGRFWWSSNWFPNSGRSYTHSTHEMAYGEEFNLALTDYLVGRVDEGYAIVRASLNGIFNGPTPGGLSCHSQIDGRQRANDEFADGISMWDRLIVEGLFGIRPKMQDDLVELSPMLPESWPSARIETKHFSYAFTRKNDTMSIKWSSAIPVFVRLHWPFRNAKIGQIANTGTKAAHLEPGFGITWLVIENEKAKQGEFVFDAAADTSIFCEPLCVTRGEHISINVCGGAKVGNLQDPQGLLANVELNRNALECDVVGSPGHGVLFVEILDSARPRWAPIDVTIQDPAPAQRRPWARPDAGDHDLARWTLIDCTPVFNASINEALEKVNNEATPPPPGASRVGFDYWRSHLGARHHGDPVQVPSDETWRKKIGTDGIAWTADGIPFKTSKEGSNIAIITQTGPYTPSIDVPVKGAGRTLYLMLSGMSFPTQSHVVHLSVTLHYADGTVDTRDLVSPFDIGDCWSTWCGRWHDTAANGFENLGGRFGPAGSIEVPDLTKPINVDTEAHLVPFELQHGKPLEKIRIEAVANDIVFGLMGATILK